VLNTVDEQRQKVGAGKSRVPSASGHEEASLGRCPIPKGHSTVKG
jgi:hypothetical protein